ncbi:MAG: pyrroline-5-carboxylate reductase [Pseudomonadota bacterium]
MPDTDAPGLDVGEGLLLIGCGKMGGALLQGWLAQGLDPTKAVVIEPNPEALLGMGSKTLRHITDTQMPPGDFMPSVVVFAVKPQMMGAALPLYRAYVREACVFLSVAAGTTIASMTAALGDNAAVVRAMPNTPAAVGRGMTVLAANANASTGQRDLCQALMAGVGRTDWVDDEALMDPVTGVSGSGPAYVFWFVECLAQAGVDAGLPTELAMTLARQTVAGAGELLYQSPEAAGQLRQNVTSPAGTTYEALQVLMAEDGLQPLMSRAVAAATRRSRELAG